MKAVFVLLSALSISCFSQNINFSDLEFKRYLIHELCVDTLGTFWGTGHIDADLNNDSEIQLSEAESITQLLVEDFSNSYSIKTLTDLHHFKNLKWLKIVSIDSVVEISKLGLDSMTDLWIGTNRSLKIIDVSDLSELRNSLRVEDLDTIDYINVVNGRVPTVFSLFYSEHIHYACVDSIKSEYDDLAWRMIAEPPVIETCSMATDISDIEIEQEPMLLFPNPSAGVFYISFKSIEPKVHLKIVNYQGQEVYKQTLINLQSQRFELSLLPGYYLIQLTTNDNQIEKRLLIK